MQGSEAQAPRLSMEESLNRSFSLSLQLIFSFEMMFSTISSTHYFQDCIEKLWQSMIDRWLMMLAARHAEANAVLSTAGEYHRYIGGCSVLSGNYQYFEGIPSVL